MAEQQRGDLADHRQRCDLYTSAPAPVRHLPGRTQSGSLARWVDLADDRQRQWQSPILVNGASMSPTARCTLRPRQLAGRRSRTPCHADRRRATAASRRSTPQPSNDGAHVSLRCDRSGCGLPRSTASAAAAAARRTRSTRPLRSPPTARSARRSRPTAPHVVTPSAGAHGSIAPAHAADRERRRHDRLHAHPGCALPHRHGQRLWRQPRRYAPTRPARSPPTARSTPRSRRSPTRDAERGRRRRDRAGHAANRRRRRDHQLHADAGHRTRDRLGPAAAAISPERSTPPPQSRMIAASPPCSRRCSDLIFSDGFDPAPTDRAIAGRGRGRRRVRPPSIHRSRP